MHVYSIVIVRQILAILVLVLFSSTVYSNSGFECVVKQVLELKNNGELQQSGNMYVGQKFVANTQSGEMTGALPITNPIVGTVKLAAPN